MRFRMRRRCRSCSIWWCRKACASGVRRGSISPARSASPATLGLTIRSGRCSAIPARATPPSCSTRPSSARRTCRFRIGWSPREARRACSLEMTQALFRDDSYRAETEAAVLASEPRGIILDRTVFYPRGGGQGGDRGALMLDDGTSVPIADTVYDADRATILHVPVEGAAALPRPGARVTARIDWELRFRRMRAHTALHLLSVVAPDRVTGGSGGDAGGRPDFDSGEVLLDRAEVERRLNELFALDRAVTHRWIADEELEANPGLIKTMSVKPPMGTGRVRLIAIEGLDLQPCGGTHVARTGEVGRASVTGIEKKGKINRRVRIALEPA